MTQEVGTGGHSDNEQAEKAGGKVQNCPAGVTSKAQINRFCMLVFSSPQTAS